MDVSTQFAGFKKFEADLMEIILWKVLPFCKYFPFLKKWMIFAATEFLAGVLEGEGIRENANESRR